MLLGLCQSTVTCQQWCVEFLCKRHIRGVVGSEGVYTGRTLPLYANNVELLEMGAIEADNLSPQKARVLLMLAMTKTRDTEELRAYFNR